VDGEPEDREGEHGVQGGEARCVVAHPGQEHLNRQQHEEGKGHADRAPRPRAEQREHEQRDRRGVERPAEPLMGVEALRTEDPEAGEEELDDDAGRHQQSQAVIDGGEGGPHRSGTYRPDRLTGGACCGVNKMLSC